MESTSQQSAMFLWTTKNHWYRKAYKKNFWSRCSKTFAGRCLSRYPSKCQST